MASSMTKSQLASELAEMTGSSITAMQKTLDALAQVAYRETKNGFVIPGICKLTAVKRKPRKFRHPITGQLFLIGERMAVSATPLKKCKLQAVPQEEDLIKPLEEEPQQPSTKVDTTPIPTTTEPQQPPASAPPTPEAAQPTDPASITFECPHCGNTVAAPAEYAGMLGQCPFCSGEINIPNQDSAPATPAFPTTPDSPPKGPPAEFTGFVTFFCRACSQEVEAPKSMIGAEASCPSCGLPVFVPAEDEVRPEPTQDESGAADQAKKPDLSSMTIRIDLSDLA